MDRTKSLVEQADDLRRHAKVMLPLYQSTLPAIHEITLPSEMLEAQRELQLCQIELDMQNNELNRTQVELATSRARYFNIFESATAGYCTLNERGMILEDNQVFAAMLGETKVCLVGQQLTKFIFREDQDTYYLYSRQLLETGKLYGCELRMVRKDATALSVHMEATAERDNAGTAISLVSVTDITADKQAEQRATNIFSKVHPSAKMVNLGVSLGCHRVFPGPLLSKRETEVLCLLGQGMTSKQMAEKLSISSRTVDSHRQRIMQKLEISNGPGLVKFAIRHGFDSDQ
jgi:PAS domain S-box-containing protein